MRYAVWCCNENNSSGKNYRTIKTDWRMINIKYHNPETSSPHVFCQFSFLQHARAHLERRVRLSRENHTSVLYTRIHLHGNSRPARAHSSVRATWRASQHWSPWICDSMTREVVRARRNVASTCPTRDYVLDMLLGSQLQSNRSMEGSVNKAVKLGSEFPGIRY